MERCLNCMEIYDEQYDVCPFCGFVKGTPPLVASHLIPGTIIDNRYIIGTVIGYGGFGITYLAWDIELGIKIAVKEYYPNGLVNRVPGTEAIIVLGGEKRKQYYAGLERFLQEAKTMAKFSSEPNIVHVYGFVEENQTAYIIMEHLEGIDLKEYVRQFSNEIMPIEDAVSVIREIGKALTAIHKDKIVHRDISPDNIFVCLDGRVKLLDFGAARLSSGEEDKTLSVVLKPGYAPPEQYRSKSKQGPRTDIYALAATLYRLVTGKLPLESLDRVVEDTIQRPSEINSEVPAWLDSVIMTGMAINAEVRFAGADKFIAALDHEKTVKLPAQKIRLRRISRSIAVIAVALIVGVVGYSYFGMYSDISGEGVPNGNISVWIPVDSEQDESRYREFESSFEKKFNGKTIDVKYIDSKDYKMTIEEAISSESAPTVFAGDFIDDVNAKENIRNLYSDIPMRHMHLIRENSSELEKERKIPMGFSTYVLFENTYLSGSADVSFVEEGGVEIDKEKTDSLIFDERYTKSGTKVFDMLMYSENAQQEFIDEKIVFYVGNVSEKTKIQKVLSGYSDTTLITYDGSSYGRFEDCLSINAKADNKEKKIAKLMLKYGLSEEGQNVLCVRNQGMLPLNKKAFTTFTEINSSLSFIEPKNIEIVK